MVTELDIFLLLALRAGNRWRYRHAVLEAAPNSFNSVVDRCRAGARR
jgi:hypothetical protein